MRRAIVILLIVFFSLAACGPVVPPSTTLTKKVEPDLDQLVTPIVEPTIDTVQPIQARVKELLGQMTLDEKIGQMTQVEKNSIQPGDITKYYIGSILSGDLYGHRARRHDDRRQH